MHNTDKLINDILVQNETMEMFSKCKQNQLTKFIHVRISNEKSIGKKALKKFGFKENSKQIKYSESKACIKENFTVHFGCIGFSTAQQRSNDEI